MTAHPKDAEDGRSFWLILSAVVIYVGLAVGHVLFGTGLHDAKM